jgi:hypothetical protein
VFKAEIGDLFRFSSTEEPGRLCVAHSDDLPVVGEGMVRPYPKGNSRVKHVLIEAMMFHKHFCSDSSISFYKRRKCEAIGKKKAVVASEGRC